MKNKNEKCCASSKMSGTNVFIGILIGLVVLVFGGKMYLQQNPAAEPTMLDSMKIDKILDSIKGDKATDLSGTWTTEGGNPAKLTLNADGTVSDMEGVTSWKAEGAILTLTNSDETTQTMELTDGNLVSGEFVYKK